MSAYDMCHKLFENKRYVTKLQESNPDIFPKEPKLTLTSEEWDSIEEMITSLLPAKQATISLQKENLKFAEFHKVWVTCFRKSEKIGTYFIFTYSYVIFFIY